MLYVLVVYFLQTFLRCVEIIVFNIEVKAKERLVGSVKMQSENANAGGTCCSNKTIICRFPSGLKSILLKVGAQSTREIGRRSCETRK